MTPSDTSAKTAPKLMPPMYFLAALLGMTALNLFAPGIRLMSSPWRFAGIALIAIGGYLAVSGSALFERLGTTIKPFEVSTVLATTGPFRLSRNPMYLGMMILLCGVAIAMGSLTPVLVIPVFGILITRTFIVHEERGLERRFGEQYLEYKRRVRRWL